MQKGYFVFVFCAIIVSSVAFQTASFLRPRKERGQISSDVETSERELDTAPIRFPGVSRLNPDSIPSEALKQSAEDSISSIPVSFFLNKDIKSNEDFIKMLVIEDKPVVLASASAETEARHSNKSILFRSSFETVDANPVAKLAACEPRMSVVEIEKPSDPSFIYFPFCTTIERCGGCCMHDLLSCQPSETEKVDIKVMKLKYVQGSSGLLQDGFVTLPLEKHNKCECRCRIQEEHCNPLQHFVSTECRCVCNNQHEAQECKGENKFWDLGSCTCSCRNVHQCSTGFMFDTETCSCQPERNTNPNIVFRLPSNTNRPPRFRGDTAYEIFGNVASPPKPSSIPTFRRLD